MGISSRLWSAVSGHPLCCTSILLHRGGGGGQLERGEINSTIRYMCVHMRDYTKTVKHAAAVVDAVLYTASTV